MRLLGGCAAVIRHHLAVMRLFVAIECCVGIQPERLNAEGDSPSALSRGCSVSATPGMPVLKEKRLEDANVVAKVAAIRVLQAHHMGRHDTEGFASPSATSHSLSSGIRPFRSCCGYGCGGD